ncbi:hypothetical protein VTI74DRAFT_11073 [Chaetomium olivicolor]
MSSTAPAPTTIPDLPQITIPPTSPQHTHTVIFLHGRGDTARGFTAALHAWHDSLGRTLFSTFPSFRWVIPQAPLRPMASTATSWRPQGEVRHQWFDVWNVRDFADREEMQLEGLREVIPAVRALIRREAEMLGGRWDRVLLAGISMGAATSVHTIFNLDVPAEGGGRLGAFLGFCARCPFRGRDLKGMREVMALGEGVPEGNEVLRRTPMMLQHCVDDPLVLIEWGRGLRDILRGFGAQVEWREYEKGGHWFKDPEGLDDLVEFVKRVVLGKGESEGGQGQLVEDGAMDLS